MIRLAGKEPDKDIKIVFKGLREGEKLYEELGTQGEGIVETGHEKIMVLQGENILKNKVDTVVKNFMSVASELDSQSIRKALQEILPEYRVREEDN